jgi:hypothetical protein
MDAFIYIVDGVTGAPLLEGGPLHVEWTDNFKDGSFSGGFAPPPSKTIKVGFSATKAGGLVVIGLVRTYPGSITIHVSV